MVVLKMHCLMLPEEEEILKYPMMKKFANPSGMAKMMKSLSGMQKQFGGGGGMGPLFGGNEKK